VTFEWDARKAAANFTKHAVAFEDAATVFLDPLATTFPDPDHSKEERREITIGYNKRASGVRIPLRAPKANSYY
jgi:hypothetical protein